MVLPTGTPDGHMTVRLYPYNSVFQTEGTYKEMIQRQGREWLFYIQGWTM